MTPAFRPLPRAGWPRPVGSLPLAGGPLWFSEVAVHEPGAVPRLLPAEAVPPPVLARLTAPRAPLAGVPLDRPRLMGILNVTPDSFSDGGRHDGRAAAVAQAEALAAAGADILDIGGESTRPGAEPVPVEAELARTIPVIAALVARGYPLPISIDTRKSVVARAALDAGASLFNDVSALTHDADSVGVAAQSGAAVCLMHAQGDPRTMQDAPHYADVLTDVLDYLAARIAVAEAAGISRDRILIDPGIGFGKTVDHNLALTRGLAILHGLGCPILFGASRKRFIGTIGAAPVPADRAPGSIAVALEALRQGAQVLRVHDVKETRQAVLLWTALSTGGE